MRLRWRVGRPVGRRTARLRNAAACGAAVAALMLMVAGLAQATSLHRTPRVVTSSFVTPRRAVVQWKPGQIVYAGDGGAVLAGASLISVSATGRISKHLIWTTWTRSEGRARGADWHDDCAPDCADGHFVPFPATIRVFRPRRIAGFLLFTRMTVTYLRAPPTFFGFRRHSVTHKLQYDARHKMLWWTFR